MSQIIHARFEDGVLKPEDPLDLPPNARVRLVVVPMSDLGLESFAAWREIERLWGDVDIDSGGPPQAATSCMTAIDTNVLIYTRSLDPVKRARPPPTASLAVG